MSESDLDSLYKSASGQDAARPSAAVRQAVLEHARRLAEEAQSKPAAADADQLRSRQRGRIERAAPSRLSRWIARWPQLRWQIALPVAAAALAVILLQPQLRSTLPAPARLQESAPPASAASRSAPAPPAPSVIAIPPPPEPFPAAPQSGQSASSAAAAAPLAAPTPPANLANSADVAASQSVAPAARMQLRPATAPFAGTRERAQAASRAAGAASLSQSELLHEAAAQGDVARVRSLLQQSALAIDARDASGRTALMLAVLHGREAVVDALLARGADPNIGDAAGRTPLAVARQQHRLPLIATLLRAGAR